MFNLTNNHSEAKVKQGNERQQPEEKSLRERVKIVTFALAIIAFIFALLARYVLQAPKLAIGFILAAWILAGYEVMMKDRKSVV